MSTRVTEVRTETAYDALQDELQLFTCIQASSGKLEAIAASLGETDLPSVRRRIDRLIRAGLVRVEGDRYLPMGQLVRALRQDAMVSSLTRLVLPALSTMVATGEGLLYQLDLDLDPDAQRELRHGLVQELLERIDGLSLEPEERKKPYICLVIGTSDVPPPGEAEERAIETVRRAARQRATPSMAERAMLLQYDCFLGPEAAAKAEALVRGARDALLPRKAEGTRIPYTLILGFCRHQQKIGEAK